MITIYDKKSHLITKFGLNIFVILLFLFCPGYFDAFSEPWIHIETVNDGDTITLSKGIRIRYIGVNAPEISHGDQPAERFGYEAKAFNQRLVQGEKIRLEGDREKIDQYGRQLAYVFLADGTFVNAELLKEGFAYAVSRKPNVRFEALFLRLQKTAMERRVGLWKNFSNQRVSLIGNRRSRRFHRESCPYGKTVSQHNRHLFQSTFEAFGEGYSPCKKCGKGYI